MSQLDRLQQTQAAIDAATAEVRDLLASILDADSFVQFGTYLTGHSRLDGSPIIGEGVLCGTATLDGVPLVVIAQNSAALYGSFGAATAAKICKALDFADRNGLPILSVLDSSGARILEGTAMLEGYGEVLSKLAAIASWGNSTHFVYIKGQAVGLMAAYAALADYRLMDAAATLCVNAPKVVKGDHSATVAAELGSVDFVCDTVIQAKDTLQSLLCWLGGTLETDDDPNREADLGQIDTDKLLAAVLDEDASLAYRSQCSPNVLCAFGFVNGNAVRLAYIKGVVDALGLAKLTAFLNLGTFPYISVIDCCGVEDSDQVALAHAIADYTMALANGFAKIAVVVGDAIGSAYTILASKGIGFDYSVATPNAYIAPLARDAAVQLVYRDRLHEAGNSPEMQAKLASEYAKEQADAFAVAEKGYLDEVIDPDTLRPYLANALNLLA